MAVPRQDGERKGEGDVGSRVQAEAAREVLGRRLDEFTEANGKGVRDGGLEGEIGRDVRGLGEEGVSVPIIQRGLDDKSDYDQGR